MKIKDFITKLSDLDPESDVNDLLIEHGDNKYVVMHSVDEDVDLAKDRLREEMSAISEDYHCAGWLANLEYDLWSTLTGENTIFDGYKRVYFLRKLSQLCDGWWYWSDEPWSEEGWEGKTYTRSKGLTFISLSEWKDMYQNHVTNSKKKNEQRKRTKDHGLGSQE